MKKTKHSGTKEIVWLQFQIKKKMAESGLSKKKWLQSINFDDNLGNVHYFLEGKRGLNFSKSVRIATAAGIDLSELQKQVGGNERVRHQKTNHTILKTKGRTSLG